MPLDQSERQNVKGYWKLIGTVGDLEQEIGFYNEQEGESREVLQRFFCHFFISGLPSHALEEGFGNIGGYTSISFTTTTASPVPVEEPRARDAT